MVLEVVGLLLHHLWKPHPRQLGPGDGGGIAAVVVVVKVNQSHPMWSMQVEEVMGLLHQLQKHLLLELLHQLLKDRLLEEEAVGLVLQSHAPSL